jgi:hypothetical protein
MGTLVPPWYRTRKTSEGGLLVGAFVYGAAMAVAAFDCTKAGRQSYRSWKRCHKATIYVMMLWAEIIMCTVASL